MARFERTTRLIGRSLRLLLRLTVTLVVIGGAGAAVFYGQSILEARAAAVPEPEAAPLTAVSVRALETENGYRQTRSFVGQIEPRKTVAVSFELAGKLVDVAVDEGDEVRAGQLIAAQDVDLLEAEKAQLNSSREALEAQLEFALQRLQRAERLLESGFASQERLDEVISARDELDARIRETDARLQTIEIRLDKSAIEAPFDGRVTRRFLDGGEALSPGQPVLEIVETEAP
ncbi:MAG: efflux RND transporter periplasmic adaptor subunit, partial [Pseudomonadota bacterium]